MEPSTSSSTSQKRQRKCLYKKEDVLNMLLNEYSDDEEFYEDSGSEFELPKRKKGLDSDDSSESDSESDSQNQSTRLSLSDIPTPSTSSSSTGKKARFDKDTGTSSAKKSTGKGKGKGKKTKGKTTEEEGEAVHVHRHLFDADNEDFHADGEIEPTQGDDGTFYEPNVHFGPEIPEFTGAAGIKFDDTGFKPIDYACQFFNAEFWDLLVTETNRKAEQFLADNPRPKKRSVAASWVPVHEQEMKQFIGVILLMGLVRKPRMRMYWSTDPLLATPMFPAIFERNRFEAIMKFLHFSDNTKEPPRDSPNRDRLFKVRPLLNLFSRTFSLAYTPGQNICIDESLLLYKGRIVFKQYIPLKRARYGIKLFCLSDTTGYLHTFRVYSGKDDPAYNLNDQVPPECADMTVTAKTTISLLTGFLDKGYHLYIDNWYSSVALYRYLLERNTLCTGTARSDRVPKELKLLSVQKGDTASLCDGQLLVQKFEDRKTVYMMTTAHDVHFVNKARHNQPDRTLPSCIDDYNKYMGGVDRLDQLIEPYDATRKTVRWYLKLGIHFIQIALLNSWCIYRNRKGKLDFLMFSRNIISKLVFPDNVVPNTKPEDVMRLTDRHFIRKIPETQRERPTRRCRVCYRKGLKRKESRYCCPLCPSQPGLCLDGCFEAYHTKEIYWE